ncbi:hypothetical protein [Grimontia marina]|uniref:Alginate export domain-containing protein n=1 Tax=Grimontia marina TaxID=646534 RepID=A0A128FBX2_9GAMM|nr:hypothetical protein [Grimontia marina]CZF83771.1 hypothetical protein GMA8713_02794 [Grimontia marina]
MRKTSWAVALVVLPVVFGFKVSAEVFEFEGEMAFEHRQYFQSGTIGQKKSQFSVALEPEFFWQTEEGNTSFTLVPFFRADALDDERTHADIREALLLYYQDHYELRVGVGKFFWGVTESQHLVDVINQTDLVESVDGEHKLGQPMMSVGIESDVGMLDLYLLPYFRERTFSSSDGRLAIPGMAGQPVRYESNHKEWYPGVAGRYSTTLEDWDVGLSGFHGTNRDPYFLSMSGSSAEVSPYYALMTQFGFDVQAIFGDWLWKAEAIRRYSLDTYTAATGGFEFTFIGIVDSQSDLGYLLEYLYDSRGTSAPVAGQNDVFAGLRWALNDIDGTEVLVGGTLDLDNTDSMSLRVEASGRFSNEWSWSLNGWLFDSETENDPLAAVKRDDFFEASVRWYF